MTAHLFEETDVQYGYNAIHKFFDIFGVAHAVAFIESAILAAAGHTVWKQETPASLLFFMECLEALAKAMFIINYEYTGRKEAILPEDGLPDIYEATHYPGRHYDGDAWNNFPRSLSARQYHDPYKAIRKFCKYKAPPKWKQFFRDVLEYALSNTSIDEGYAMADVLKSRLHLLRMVEAAHLIEVRMHKKEIPGTAGSNETQPG